jgi:hypothetical protein
MKLITKKQIVAGLKNIHAAILEANIELGARCEIWDISGNDACCKLSRKAEHLNKIIEQLDEEVQNIENPKPQKATIITL